jgi:hypothetical protein
MAGPVLLEGRRDGAAFLGREAAARFKGAALRQVRQ